MIIRVPAGVFLDRIEQFDINQGASTSHSQAAKAVLAGIESQMSMRYAGNEAAVLCAAIATAFEQLRYGEHINGVRTLSASKYRYSVLFSGSKGTEPPEFQAVFATITLTACITESIGCFWSTREGNYSASVSCIKAVADTSLLSRLP